MPPDPAPLSAIDPDVVLFDISPPGSLGEVRRVAAAVPAARVVALAVGESENQVVACAEAGADGYVTRDQSVEDVLAVIGAVTRGELICSPRIAGALLQRLGRLAAERGSAPVDEPPVRLTAREREIVVLIDRGMSNKQIARTLTIEVATVKNHVHNILEKLHVTRRDEAVARRAPTRTWRRRCTPPAQALDPGSSPRRAGSGSGAPSRSWTEDGSAGPLIAVGGASRIGAGAVVKQIRIAITHMPRMLREIIEETVAAEADMVLVDAPDEDAFAAVAVSARPTWCSRARSRAPTSSRSPSRPGPASG